jgi:mono/diheme cytochrome c family protein
MHSARSQASLWDINPQTPIKYGYFKRQSTRKVMTRLPHSPSVVAGLIALSGAAVLVSGCGEVPVPTATSSSPAEVAKELERANLGVARRAKSSDTVDVGAVVGLDPAAGTQVASGSTVTILVSSGPPYRITNLVVDSGDVPALLRQTPPTSTAPRMDWELGDCIPDAFSGQVSEVGTGTYTAGSQGDAFVNVFDMGTADAARSMISEIGRANEACSTRGRPQVDAVSNLPVGVRWVTAGATPRGSLLVTTFQSTAPGAEVGQHVRGMALAGRYIVDVRLKDSSVPLTALADPSRPDTPAVYLLSDIIKASRQRIAESGRAAVASRTAIANGTKTAPRPDPSAAAPGATAAGKAVFEANCQGCHPAGGRTDGVGPKLAGAGLGTATIRDVVANGRGAMPGGMVSGADLDAVVAYVKNLQG